MALRCLETLEINGTTFNLAQFNDFSFITSSMASGTTQRYDLGKVANTGETPSICSTLGDLILDCKSGMTESYIVGNTDYFAHRIGLYHYNNFENTSYDMFGGITKDFVKNSILHNYGWSTGANHSAMKSYLAVIFDDANERAYYCYIYDQYKHWGGTYGVYLHVYAGLSNDEDLIWKSFPHQSIIKITSNGGGATHIAKVTGQLKDLSSNLSDILMVSGGGGGGLLVGDTDYSGKEAGGISGSGDNSADQSTGNAFGLGESGTNVSGGGSGLYGGYKGTSANSGGAGSGYIGNLLLYNKKMVGYNVPTSSAEGTKTESVNEASESPVSGKPKIGNGFARIKFLREIEGHVWSTSEQVVGTWINGEPLYEITFYKDSDFDYNNMNKFDALPENFERMVYARGYVQRDGNTEFDVFNTGDTGPIIQIKVNSGYFGALVRGYAMISMAVTFRYTKSSN